MSDFAHMKLNEHGLKEQRAIQDIYEKAWEMLQNTVTFQTNPREAALARTYMQQSCFWMKKCSSLKPTNQNES